MATGKIERIIDEIEDFLSRCKYQPLSNTKIVVSKDDITDLITDLRKATAEELEACNKIMATQKEIISKAKHDAEKLYNEAAAKTNEMINQNSIMQQAYAQADQVVKDAYAEANDLIYLANAEANNVRSAAVDYLDNMLAQIENVLVGTMNQTQSHYESFYTKLNAYHDEVLANRMELVPPAPENQEMVLDASMADTGAINNTGSISNTGAINNTGTIGNTGALNAGNSDASGNTGDIKLM